MKRRVLVADKLHVGAIEALECSDALDIDFRVGLSEDELVAIIGDYDALIVRSATKATARLIDAGARLKLIGRAGVGVDNIDVERASERGIVVMNAPGANTITTAEHTIAMLVSLCRNVARAHMSMSAGQWDKSSLAGVELTGKTLGIIGMGRIGSIVADRALGLKMKVIARDPYLSPELMGKAGIEAVSLEDLLKRSDIVTIHSPKTEETSYLIDKERIAMMKDGARLINCARGGIVNESDLLEAIESGKLAGAALDVFEREPLPPDDPLRSNGKIVLTPHLGASTSEAAQKVAVAIIEQVKEFFERGAMINSVNAPALDAREWARARPYIRLAENLGSFLGQFTPGALKKIEITFAGELANGENRHLSLAALKGALCGRVENVNYVNAPIVAKARAIEIVTGSAREKSPYRSLISITITTDLETHRGEGAVFVEDEPRLTRLDDYRLEAKLSGSMIVMTSVDEPGAIGRIGTKLGELGVNIATFQLGRIEELKRALSIINVDTIVSAENLSELSEVASAIEARMAHLP